ncbi:MAG TPA: aldo/keto reductase [Terriglobales bacterium]|nr:aldo/keto reductase [Terriglobales bacterium]
MIAGFATPEGTSRFRSRFTDLANAGFYRHAPGVPAAGDLWLSSIGIGTYLGDPTAEADVAYTAALLAAIGSGINVLDTAINYRHQRSERNLGEALRQAVAAGTVSRDEVLVCTKAGYLPFDTDMPRDAVSYLRREYIESGLAPAGEIVGGSHCMNPRYLSDQIERSRRNLGLQTLDVFYVHNPESQLSHVSRELFYSRLRTAFEMLERAVSDNRIRYYGAATWNGFRANPADRSHLSVEHFVQIATQVAGKDHHFRFVQLPFNLAMLEAYAYANQSRDGANASLLTHAPEFGVAVVGSGTLHQGNLTSGLPEQLKQILGSDTDSEAAIQFARSATNLTTSLVGMGSKRHVETNLQVASKPLMPREGWEALFARN